ncbi:MAG: zinc-dependent metalloprotease [Bdellovibrionaceae bacterium]|nr:zinc-dependent metalloprotease [Pseudobdellovibrionaceae bacterium]
MKQQTYSSKAVLTMLALSLFVTSCTKSRDAELPEDAQETMFAISEIETDTATVKTDDQMSQLSLGDSAKATAEKGIVALSEVNVPARLKFMFRGLEISGAANRNYPIALSVDRQFVTAYKIVSDPSELTAIEKGLVEVKEEVSLQKQLQKTSDQAQSKKLMAALLKIRASKINLLAQKSGTLMVPIFKYKVAAFGVLQKTKNEYKEETSVLRLRPTDWAEASHIQIAIKAADRLPVGIDPAFKGDLDRTFVMDRINNKVMSAETLNNDFKIPVNLSNETRVLTLLDVDTLHVFEIGQIGKTVLTDSQSEQLKTGSVDANVRRCSADIVKTLPAASQKDCILVLRYDVPVKYVKPETALVDYEGNKDSKVQFKTVRAGEAVGLVQIAEDVQAKKVESNNELDPRTSVRVADIKDKEFFFKRTLEDAPETLPFEPGFAGNLTIVKFDLQENRVVVRKADKIVAFKAGSNDYSYEEIMSLPVTYLKREFKDASGAKYSAPRLVKASRQDAEYIDIDWTKNTLTADNSPYETIQEACIKSIGDANVTDVDMKLDKGVLNFSYNYSVGLKEDCINSYNLSDYNGTASSQNTARLKERVSFKLNDGSTNETFVGKVPFRVQNALGYGVWTIGKLKPTAAGVMGHEGEEESIAVVQDFRNNRVLKYVVTGLENRQNEIDPEIRKMYIETIKEVVNGWDLAYRQVFKGTAFDRTGRYLEVEIAGENGVEAHVGDLDKNIIHFENKVNIFSGGLGVSQVGFNPRSGIVVADSLIIFAGNLQAYIANGQTAMRRAQLWNDEKAVKRTKALEALAASGAAKAAVDTSAKVKEKVADLVAGAAAARKTNLPNKAISFAKARLEAAVQQRRAVGDNDLFKYASPEKMRGAWIDKALRKVTANPSMSNTQIQAIVASEMLAEGTLSGKLSAKEQSQLGRLVRKGKMDSIVNARMKSSPGCMLAMDETLPRTFIKKSFKEALKSMLYFDLAHEMGHSQGLTHNFIGSYDKSNFSNEDGSKSNRNYSSIMDYFANGQFSWDGLGTYDIHALRASHLGLLEAKPSDLNATNRTPKFVSINDIKNNFAKAGWNNFNKVQIANVLKPYKYCTDIHLGYEPNCDRFDTGTTAAEIVDQLISDYDSSYINLHYAWDRTEFGAHSEANAYATSVRTMVKMRQFLDELFYIAVTKKGTQEDVGDLAQASFKAYIFLQQVIRTPDAGSVFMSDERFLAVPYTYKETAADGTPTGKEINDVEIVEKRALQRIENRPDRLDTIGIESDKVIALNILTLKGLPYAKYESSNIEFSYLDFEKYFMQLTPQTSLYVATATGMLMNDLKPTFTNAHAVLQPIDNANAEVSSEMRAYSGIYSILGLQATTLRDQDNFANLFKVGSSVGILPGDRISLSQLGVSEDSKVKINYWPLDNATAANDIMQKAAKKSVFIKKIADLTPIFEKLITAQVTSIFAAGAKDAAGISKAGEELRIAKESVLKALNDMNTKGEIVSEAVVKANPNQAMDQQVERLLAYNEEIIKSSITLTIKPELAKDLVPGMSSQSKDIANAMPLFAFDQKLLAATMTKLGAQFEKVESMKALKDIGASTSALVDEGNLEFSYGLIMKNIEFLGKLTNMTNPEYNR